MKLVKIVFAFILLGVALVLAQGITGGGGGSTVPVSPNYATPAQISSATNAAVAACVSTNTGVTAGNQLTGGGKLTGTVTVGVSATPTFSSVTATNISCVTLNATIINVQTNTVNVLQFSSNSVGGVWQFVQEVSGTKTNLYLKQNDGANWATNTTFTSTLP